MAASNWGTDRRVEELLFAKAWEFDFFQAVCLLQRRYREEQPEGDARESEAVRFRVKNSLAFPASSIVEVDHGKPGHGSSDNEKSGPPQMTVTFLGLTGAEGVLPAAYTELAVDRECFGDTSFADFLDLFNHRLIWLFYRSWEKHHFFVEYERSQSVDGGPDSVTSGLFDLIGMGTLGLRGRLPVPDEALLRYAGLLAQRPHSAECLRALLHDYFELPVRVEQLLGRWHTLEHNELCCLGSEEENSQLGCGAVAGDSVWTRHALVRLVFGPLAAAQFQSLLPCGERFRKVAAITRWFLGAALDFEVQPTLRGDEVPSCQLSDDSAASRLGWSAWLRTDPFPHAAEDAVFAEQEAIGLEA
jgi:type VI secretion system protein ImpH